MIGLHAHAQKPAAAEVVRAMARELDLAGLPYLLDQSTAPLAGKTSTLDLASLAEKSELGAEGHVIRELNAYPVYDAEYRPHVDTLRAYFQGFSNLQTVGRNGMHRYNNQDHSMLAGHHAALRLLGRPELDPWEVNTERSYYEEQVLSPDKKHEGIDILVPEKAPPSPKNEISNLKSQI